MAKETEVKTDADTAEQEAELEAAADSIASAEQDEEAEDKTPYLVKFYRTYQFNGKDYAELDLSGLADLTTLDAEHVERVMEKMNYAPKDKFRDTIYTKHIAMRATGLPVEFFNALSVRDMMTVTAKVYRYFLVG